jgi:hypothetical protein
VGQVVVDLSPHAFDLLGHGGGEIVMPLGIRHFRLARENRQRRFQAVREIAGLGDRPAYGSIAVFEEAIEVVDERLDLRRI